MNSQAGINAAFAEYYRDLYVETVRMTEDAADAYVVGMQIPTIDPLQWQELDTQLSYEEVKGAMAHMAHGKKEALPDVGLPWQSDTLKYQGGQVYHGETALLDSNLELKFTERVRIEVLLRPWDCLSKYNFLLFLIFEIDIQYELLARYCASVGIENVRALKHSRPPERKCTSRLECEQSASHELHSRPPERECTSRLEREQSASRELHSR
ncbi:hypothetical protein NDU88_001792 [Pleurodeles waltl]|uniref:Uncharacterized protein n=1 Tax=Pleurodeles waltl TaxID=8319 RepID=A0AAV7U8M6_PLEWA|nr:hypothetical protein NDU88_001792 [Pleurodeles waltl]